MIDLEAKPSPSCKYTTIFPAVYIHYIFMHLSHPACTAAVFNLSAPLVFQEQDKTFTATIALLQPSGGSTFPIEIDIMETEITATPFGKHDLFV